MYKEANTESSSSYWISKHRRQCDLFPQMFPILGPFNATLNVHISISISSSGAWDGVFFKALRYYSDGPGIDSRWCHWIFQWHIPSDRTMALGSTQPLVKIEYQEHFLEVKAAIAWGWRPHHLHVPNIMEIWEPKPPGTLWATSGLLRDPFTFTYVVFM
jgi:hypothetical protein